MMTRYLADNSVWSRFSNQAIPAHRRGEIADAIGEDRVSVSVVLMLEAGYSAIDAPSHEQLVSDLEAMPFADFDRAAAERAVDLQRQLVRVGHHRVPPADLMTMAIAERHGLTVLHYDKDYDVIREKSDCAATTEWIAPRGSV